MVFFDLPVETSKNRSDYARFHKYLINRGFIMYQKSVYFKLAVNNVASKAIRDHLKKNLPPSGNVSLLEITEKQFNSIEMMLGAMGGNVIQTMDKVVEID